MKINRRMAVVIAIVIAVFVVGTYATIIISNTSKNKSQTNNSGETTEENTWKISVITKGEPYSPRSLCIDSKGGLHLCFFEHGLKYAYKPPNSTSWKITTVDSSKFEIGHFTSYAGREAYMALDSNGGVHIIYQSANRTDLKYAYKPARESNWTIETIDTAEEMGHFMSMATDPENNIHICYVYYITTNNKTIDILAYTHKPYKGNWEKWVVDEGEIGPYPSIGVDSRKGVHIVYQYANSYEEDTNMSLKYAYKPYGGNWTITTLEGNGWACGDPSLTIDSEDGIHICYSAGKINYSCVFASKSYLKYAYKPKGGNWEISVVDDSRGGGIYISIAVDSNGGVHISYYNDQHQSLKYAYKPKNGNWSITTVDDYKGGYIVGTETSIAVDKEGGVHIVYSDDSRHTVKYAYKPPSKAFTKNIQNLNENEQRTIYLLTSQKIEFEVVHWFERGVEI